MYAQDIDTDERQDSLEIADDSLMIDSLDMNLERSRKLTLQEKIDTLLTEDLFKKSTVGIMIYDITGDSIVYMHNERQCLRPASTMKMFTAITALDKLGSDYRFSTSLKLKGTMVQRTDTLGNNTNRIFVGDITAVGGMDPRFSKDDMKAFVDAIRKEKVDTIYGTLLADKSFKDDDRLGAGWCWDDKNPCLTPLLWDRNDRFIENLRRELNNAKIVILPSTAQPRDSVYQAQFAAGRKYANQTLSTRYHSIESVMNKMMKSSDNLYAECMFYQIAHRQKGNRTGASGAREVMNNLIRKLKLNPSDYRIADGSGLSLYNYLSPQLEVELLRYAYRNSNIYSYLLPTLPISGVDGTLRKRMTRVSCKGHVKAKTGTVEGVSALTGYVFTEKGNILCFSIINQGIRKSSYGRNFQDKVCQIMYTYNPVVEQEQEEPSTTNEE